LLLPNIHFQEGNKEELYNVREDPNSFINLAYDEEYKLQVEEMRQLLVNWMTETDHPALELMKDPYNKQLIANYKDMEKQNTVKQIDEIKELKKKK